MNSKTYWITLLSTLILQYAGAATEYVQKIAEYAAAFVPPPFNLLVAGVVPVVLSWLITVAVVWARNNAVKEGTIASPATGRKLEGEPDVNGKGIW